MRYTYVYRCWKCKKRHKIAQDSDRERTDLKCMACGRSLLRVNSAPGLVTDTTFMAGRDDGFGTNEWGRKRAREKAKAAGVNVEGAVYCPELCPPGESLSPKAWVRGRSDVVKKARELGYGVQGAVNAPAPEVEPQEKKPYRVNDEIVDRRVKRKLEEVGETVSKKEYQEMWHKEADLASGNA